MISSIHCSAFSSITHHKDHQKILYIAIIQIIRVRDHIQARNMSDTFVIRYCLFHLGKVFTSIVSGPLSIEEIEKITHSCKKRLCKFYNRKQIDSSPLHPPPSTVHYHCQITIYADDMPTVNKYFKRWDGVLTIYILESAFLVVNKPDYCPKN